MRTAAPHGPRTRARPPLDGSLEQGAISVLSLGLIIAFCATRMTWQGDLVTHAEVGLPQSPWLTCGGHHDLVTWCRPDGDSWSFGVLLAWAGAWAWQRARYRRRWEEVWPVDLAHIVAVLAAVAWAWHVVSVATVTSHLGI